MPILKRLFDVIGFFQVLNILDLRSSYCKGPLLIEDWIKTIIWRVDQNNKD